VSSGQGNTAAAIQGAPIQPLPALRAFARIFPAFQNVPLVSEKAGVTRFIAWCGQGQLVGFYVAN
jgi:hypothetical protein